MITVTAYKDSITNQFTGFLTKGHAGYARVGKDIICSAVSAIIITTINSIDQLTSDSFQLEEKQESGYIKLQFDSIIGADTMLLIQSMLIGLSGIRDTYGAKYLQINTKEVEQL